MMNEQIKQLAKQQAGAILMDLVMPDSGMPERVKWNVGITTEHLEKFAELIVRECLDIVNRKEYSYHEADPLWETSQLIKEHFGVKE
jgi:hypothetical protein